MIGCGGCLGRLPVIIVVCILVGYASQGSGPVAALLAVICAVAYGYARRWLAIDG